MQRDLFGGPQTLPAAEAAPKTDFLERYRISLRLDQAIVALILFLVIYVLVFSFGVETGKRYAIAELTAERAKREQMVQELSQKLLESQPKPAEEKHETQPITAKPAAAVRIEQKTQAAPAPASAAHPNIAANKSPKPVGKYTIQMVTFVSQSLAEKEIKKLAQKGYQGFVISTGRHYQVCVNAFETRQRASENLKQLKAQGFVPRDAYVRTLA